MASQWKTILGRLLHITKWIPTSSKILYPFWLSAQLDVVDEAVVIDHLPAAFDGLVIAYCSDIHYGPFFGKKRAEDLARKLNGMRADIMLLGGDYGETAKTSLEFFKALPDLTARSGIFAVIGNHDLLGHKEEISELKGQILSKGIVLLCNSAILINKCGSSLCLCATDDILEGRPDTAALTGAIAQSDFTIFAPHSPDILPEAEKQAGFRFDLALCGHTHGGQLVVFGRSLHSSSAYGDTYARGWMDAHGGKLLVTHGVGTSLLPMRLGVRPQVHRITLKRNRSD